ncbi:MAG TPA: glycosyltransferase [Candidatus Binataceae bacterium]|nr:glycosyltransferase [Candidatus Binataceae bacterium]
MTRWEIITGEYPPQPGGVADYSQFVARALVSAGDEVAIHAPGSADSETDDAGVRVCRLPDRFGRAARRELSHTIDGRARILVQYVPHAFGLKAMNLPFCIWLYQQRHRDVTVMFHEVAYPIRRQQPMRRNLLGTTHRLMAALVARSAKRILVAAEAWRSTVRAYAPADCPILWAPVPGNIPVVDDTDAMKVQRMRYAPRGEALIGHFGTYGTERSQLLRQALQPILDSSGANLLLIGRGSEEFRTTLVVRYPSAANRVHATGSLDRGDASLSISACDAMLQPYEDGITSRNASAIAALAHSRPLVANAGSHSENMWNRSAGVLAIRSASPRELGIAALDLVRDRERARAMGCAGAALYQEVFDLRHTVNLLREVRCEF